MEWNCYYFAFDSYVQFNILLLGGPPYPRLGPREVLRRLKKGWRMQKPNHVNTELLVHF